MKIVRIPSYGFMIGLVISELIKSLVAIWFLSILMGCAPTRKPPNIILIMADDLGYETLRVNGGTSYQTPNLDRMAKDGIRFEHCYAQPLCTPSRIQIMTGIYNVRNYVTFGILDTAQTTFAHLFKEAGYQNCIVGKWQLGADSLSPYWAGFDEYALWQVTPGNKDSTGRDTRFSQPMIRTNGIRKRYAKFDYGPELVTNYGLDFIERSVKEDKPFLLYYPMILTHCPFSPTPDSPEWTVDDTTVMRYKGKAHYFEDMVMYMDKIVGQFQDKLEELEVVENTMFVFTADNGTDVPVVSRFKGRDVAGAKSKSTDAGTRVPLIVKWPDKIAPGQVNNDLVDMTDFLPTLCTAAELALPVSPKLDGRSFWPQCLGQEGNPRDWIYSWYSRNGETEKARVFARTHTYKLYSTGEFYHIPQDWEEKRPLNQSELDSNARNDYVMLEKVIDDYAPRRLELIEVQ